MIAIHRWIASQTKNIKVATVKNLNAWNFIVYVSKSKAIVILNANAKCVIIIHSMSKKGWMFSVEKNSRKCFLVVNVRNPNAYRIIVNVTWMVENVPLPAYAKVAKIVESLDQITLYKYKTLIWSLLDIYI